MKSTLALTLALALAVAPSAFAGETSDKFEMPIDSQLEGVALPTGNYRVEWQGAGPSVEVTVSKGSTVLVKTQATLTELSQKTPQDAATVETVAGGTRVLTALRFGGKKVELRFAEAAAQKQAPSAASPVKSASRMR